MNAKEFLKGLANGKVIGEESHVVSGEVRLTLQRQGRDAESDTRFSRYTVEKLVFEDEVIADAAQLTARLEFRDCVFKRGISARNLRAASGLVFLDCRIYAPEDSFAVCFDGAKIEGDLHFRSNIVKGHILARRMHVTGDVLFNGVRACTREGRLPEASCSYRRLNIAEDEEAPQLEKFGGNGTSILNLRGSRIDGTLNLGGLAYERPLEVGDTERRDPDGYPELTVLAGRVDGVGLQIGQSINLWNAQIGELDLSGIKVGKGLNAEALVRPATEGGQLACRLEVHGPIQLTHAEVKGDVRLDGVIVHGDLFCALSSITGVLTGYAVHIDRERWCYTWIGGRVWLSASEIGFVAFRGADIRGALLIMTGTFNRLYLGPHLRAVKSKQGASRETPFRLEYKPTRVRAVDIRAVKVSEILALAGLDLEEGESPERAATLRDGGSVQISESTIGGPLVLGTDGTTETTINSASRYGDTPGMSYASVLGECGIEREQVEDFQRLLPDVTGLGGNASRLRDAWFTLDASCPALIPGVVDLSHNTIGGELEISNVHVGGEIRLDDTRVGRDLRASRFGMGHARTEGTASLYRTRCTRFEMQNLECEGDADLTGVVLRGESPELSGRYSTIKGDLLIWSKKHDAPRDSIAPEQMMGADLCCGIGRLDLSAASIGRLVIAGANFSIFENPSSSNAAATDYRSSGGDETGSHDVPAGVEPTRRRPASDPGDRRPVLNLEHAKVGRLEIRQPTPTKMRLSGIEVREWELSPEDAYIKVLKGTDDFFSGDVYTQVEESLRNDGRNNLADEVYVLMRKRLEKKMREKGERIRLLLSYMHFGLTKYGTSTLLPFLWILLITSINLLFLHDPRNIAASTAYMEAMSETELAVAKLNAASAVRETYGATAWPVVTDIPPEALGHDWTLGDMLGITVRFSVPLIALAMNDRWDPARWHAVVPCAHKLINRPAPEDGCAISVKVVTITRITGYISWILWPLFILRVSSVIKRRG